MKVYLVGGCVRDQLLGLEPKDLDYVVVGSSPEEMVKLGYTQVGKDFPVFLHPTTKDEYALARTERKQGVGHTGFTCDWEGVTLEEDLGRRDLTINSIAMDLTTDEIIDPYNGQQDLKDKVLRHTTDAFSEDPLRVLRVARFAARLGSDWIIHSETLHLMDNMYIKGELDSLTPERVWLETEKALSTGNPSVYFEYLKKYKNSLFSMTLELEDTVENNPHHPEDHVWIHTSMVMDKAAELTGDPEVVFAAYTHDFGKPYCYQEFGNGHGHEKEGLPFILEFTGNYKVPNRFTSLALMVCEHHQKVHSCMGRGTNKGMRAKSIMKLFEATNAMKKPECFEKMLLACECDAKGRGDTPESIKEFNNKPYPQADYLRSLLKAAINTDTKSVSKRLIDQGKTGKVIGLEIRSEIIKSIRQEMNKYGE